MAKSGHMVGSLGWLASGHKLRADVDIFGRWKLGQDDRAARRIAAALETTWRHWTVQQRESLLAAAEAIARAELSKEAWNPKEVKNTYTELALLGVDAARLARNIAKTFPPPWDDDSASIRQLTSRLMDFTNCVLTETSVADHDAHVQVAVELVERFRSVTPQSSGRASWTLLARLAWLASGKNQVLEQKDESAMRRYQRKPPAKFTPAAPTWRRSWKMLGAAAAAVRAAIPSRERHSEAFQPPIRRLLGRDLRGGDN